MIPMLYVVFQTMRERVKAGLGTRSATQDKGLELKVPGE